MSLACGQPVCFKSGEHDHLTVRRRRIPDAVGRSVLARGINPELDRLGDKLEGVADQRPTGNKRRELAFINGGVHRADYTRYICAMILARAVFTAGRFPTFTAQSSTGEATARRQ